MIGIVWGSTFKHALDKIKEIEESYKRYHTSNLISKRETKYSYELTYNNGDRWLACRATESQRGHKCNVSYIDTNISVDFIETIIIPSTVAGPYQAINYYN
jgi:hypothetical protein